MDNILRTILDDGELNLQTHSPILKLAFETDKDYERAIRMFRALNGRVTVNTGISAFDELKSLVQKRTGAAKLKHSGEELKFVSYYMAEGVINEYDIQLVTGA